jgi:hypothetical protein
MFYQNMGRTCRKRTTCDRSAVRAEQARITREISMEELSVTPPRTVAALRAPAHPSSAARSSAGGGPEFPFRLPLLLLSVPRVRSGPVSARSHIITRVTPRGAPTATHSDCIPDNRMALHPPARPAARKPTLGLRWAAPHAAPSRAVRRACAMRCRGKPRGQQTSCHAAFHMNAVVDLGTSRARRVGILHPSRASCDVKAYAHSRFRGADVHVASRRVDNDRARNQQRH